MTSSSYINHFLQPDTLIPDPASPQNLNRYSYVGNRPINFNDPTGHYCADSDGNGKPVRVDCEAGKIMTGSDGGSGNGGGGNNGGANGIKDLKDLLDRDAADWLAECGDSFSNVAGCLDIVALAFASLNAVVTDVMMTKIIVAGCATGVGCPAAIPMALSVDFAASTMTPVGTIENILGFISLAATGYSDIIENHTTSFVFDDVSGMTINIGQDTLVAAKNMALGFIPEVNNDAYVSYKQVIYDIGRMNGDILATTGYSMTIPTPKSISNNASRMFWNLATCDSIICLHP